MSSVLPFTTAQGRQYENSSEMELCKFFCSFAWSGQNTIPFMGSSDSMLLLSATERSAAKEAAASIPVVKTAVEIPAKTDFFIPHSIFLLDVEQYYLTLVVLAAACLEFPEGVNLLARGVQLPR